MFSCKKVISPNERSCEFWYIGSDKFARKNVLIGKYKRFYLKSNKFSGCVRLFVKTLFALKHHAPPTQVLLIFRVLIGLQS
jgi:hypothetical protein